MAIARSEGGDALALDEAKAAEREATAPGTGLLHHLRRAWASYRSENERGWEELVKEQAEKPTLE